MYFIIYGFLYLFSLLPFFILYRISDFVAFMLHSVLGYRKRIIIANLLQAFPEKTDKERKRIAKKFYLNFTDNFIETIKTLSISEKDFDKRCVGNFEVINEVASRGKNIQLLGAHKFNWEYANLALGKNIDIPFIAIYSPIETSAFNKLFLKIRSKYKTILVPTGSFKRKMHELMQKQHSMYLLADQNPGNLLHAYWLNFFGKLSPFINGPHRSAAKSGTAIIFVDFKKIKRGYYSFEAVKVIDDAAEFTPQQLTIQYRDFIETVVREQPDNYLWSHRRWKYHYTAEPVQILIEH
ncbi:MAG: lysophospholipid acyltransferase family protein [Bacteroidota bacterium]